MKILTGSTGTNHITAADDGALHAAIVGDGQFVFELGSKFATTIVNSSTIQIADGEGLLQGRHFRTEPGATDTVTLADCAEGYNRNDLIGVQYSNVAGTESVEWVVIQGTDTTGDATDPSYDVGDLLSGGASAFMPMFRAKLRGPSLSGVDVLYTTAPSIKTHTEAINKAQKTADNAAKETGLAASATKLATARTIKVNLGSGNAASFNGTANVTPGVTGVLQPENGGTGGTTAAEARANLGAASVALGTAIPSGADLNDYTTHGAYYSVSGTNSATLSNTPYTGTGFRLDVFATVSTSSHIMQEIKANAASARTYRRIASINDGVWTFGEWYWVMQTTSGVIAISQGGHGATTAAGALKNLGATPASYSTSEVATGGTFVDGKALYRKTIKYTNTSTGLLDYDISSLGADYINIVENVINFSYDGSGSYWASGAWLGATASSTEYDYHRTYVKDGVLKFATGAKIIRIAEYVTLEYTKA